MPPRHVLTALWIVLGAACSDGSAEQPRTPEAPSAAAQMVQMDMTSGSNTPMDHSHLPVPVPDGVTPPRLSTSITADWMSGYNLKIEAVGFDFMVPPKDLSMTELMAPAVNETTGYVTGHAHLYINGEKIRRLYSTDVHIPDTLIKPGINHITVSINNHAHMYYMANDRQVLSTRFLNPEAESLIVHRFDSFPVLSDDAH